MSASPQRVIACVTRRGDALLVCQRPADKQHGGLWEFPGGKTEPGESDADAAARELAEELGVELLDASMPMLEVRDADSRFIIVFLPVRIVGEPTCIEHQRLTWARPAELLDLPLAPSDRTFVEFLMRSDPQTSHE